MESCSELLVDNKLSLHLGKTECVQFGPKRKLKKKMKILMSLEKGQVIKSQDSVKYIGLFIDNFLDCKIIVTHLYLRLIQDLNSCTDTVNI